MRQRFSKIQSEAHTPKRSLPTAPPKMNQVYWMEIFDHFRWLCEVNPGHILLKKIYSKCWSLLFITWKKTHLPRSIALLMRASALGPWPCPSDIAFNFLENLISSANLYRATAGSVPGDKTKMRGTEGDESLNTWKNRNRWIIFYENLWGRRRSRLKTPLFKTRCLVTRFFYKKVSWVSSTRLLFGKL